MQKIKFETEMADSEAIETIANQVAIQAVTAEVMVLTEADARPRSGTNTANPMEVHRQTWCTSSETAVT